MKTTIETPGAATAAPVIELKKFHYAAFASEETSCYAADVWVNGRPGFSTKNDGHGGCDFYGPISYTEQGRKDEEVAMAILTAHAASLPLQPWPEEWGKDGGHQPDVESLIGDAVSAKLTEREVEKFMKKLLTQTFCVDAGKLFSFKKGIPTERLLPTIRSKYPNATVLNLLSQVEARAQFAKLL